MVVEAVAEAVMLGIGAPMVRAVSNYAKTRSAERTGAVGVVESASRVKSVRQNRPANKSGDVPPRRVRGAERAPARPVLAA